MEKTPHTDFFTDNQAAVVLGLTLRSLQNRIHRAKVSKKPTLPPHHMASARGRLWEKKALKAFLEEDYDDPAFVTERMEKGSKAPPLGSLGATDPDLKIPDNILKKKVVPKAPEVPKRGRGRPRKHPL